MNNIVLLLTACISPNGMAFTALQNPETRKTQYINAMQWYLDHTPYNIVFVENTNTYIGNQFSKYIAQGRVEFITFEGNGYPRELGKGYGEALIIKEGFAKSKMLASADYIVKVTGRLVIRNACALIKESVNSKNKVVASISPLNNKEKICGSYFFIAHKDFYEIFLPDTIHINDSQNIIFEHVLFGSLKQWIADGNIYHEYYDCIDIDGFSGTTGARYPHRTLWRNMKCHIKAFLINVIRGGKRLSGM